MPLSRLRLHLTAWFGAAFVIGLLVLDIGFYVYSHRKAETRLSRELAAAARGLHEAIRAEESSHPGDASGAVDDAVGEWPSGQDALVVWSAGGRLLGGRGPEELRAAFPSPEGLPPGLTLRRVPLKGEPDAQVALYRDTGSDSLTVAAMLTTAQMKKDEEVLAGWLLVSLPLLALLALAAGYVLARRALRPVRELALRAAAIEPDDLHHRLPVRTPADEIDGLALQFNHLLERLGAAQSTNRSFLARAAHQLKTPLTVVRGESALGLERSRTIVEHEAILRRIQLAAEQMSRRVADLLLLARATAGDRPPLADDVELDGLVWQCADLMRARAQATHHRLELAQVDPVLVRGNEDLLREACLELIENACKHATAGTPIRLSVLIESEAALVLVVSQGGPVSRPTPPQHGQPADGEHLGLTIVEWIAGVHGGSLHVSHAGDANAVAIRLPSVIQSTGQPESPRPPTLAATVSSRRETP
jgi:signal transduction histidine kinase